MEQRAGIVKLILAVPVVDFANSHNSQADD